jgi:hypothetical protein
LKHRPPGRLRRLVAAHRRLAWTSVAIAGVLVIVAFVWFQPQKLVIDETVDEAAPIARAEPRSAVEGGGRQGSPARARPETVASGEFRSLEHTTTGRAAILRFAGGRTFLRMSNLETSNGPDLRVYLSEIPASDDWYAYGERFVDLGALKGNFGNQNYAVPADLDLSRFRSAVIWCRRFTVGFGVAPLEA